METAQLSAHRAMSATAMTDANADFWSGKDRADENFPVGMFIRPDLRGHVYAFYRFARIADDIADNPEFDAHEKLRRLDLMEAVLRGEQESGSVASLGLRASLDETGVTVEHACDLLHAFRQDATKQRYANWGELATYCRYSAMPVGRHVLDLHGEHHDSYAPSDALCAALQVLNHLQDCASDLRLLDRCYLPADMLASNCVTINDLRGPRLTPGLRTLLDRFLDLVDVWNTAGAALPKFVQDRRLRIETAGISALSCRLQRRLRDHDPLATRVKLGKLDAGLSFLVSLRHVPRPPVIV